MPENRATSSDLDRALNDAKKRAEGVAKEVKGAARDVYGQARASAADVADSATDAVTEISALFQQQTASEVTTGFGASSALAQQILQGAPAEVFLSASSEWADRLAEDGLRASQQELRRLTGRLLEAQEAERRRIARELHDDLNQRLALLSVELDLLARRPPAATEATEEVARGLRALSARTKELSAAVHDLSHQLHPSMLEHLGLLGAVGVLCKEMTRHHGLEVRFTHHTLPEVIPEGVALCLYRIAQESLRNVVKHSGTDCATVELRGRWGAIRLRVADAGAGFDPAAVTAGGGLGLVSMRERLRSLGGRLVVQSAPLRGTRIHVSVPLEPGMTTDELERV